MDQESGFIVEPRLDGSIAGLELLHRSETGFAEIWRATKFSQFVVLKALKEEYREDPVYEALLRKEFEIGYSLNHPAICRTWHFRDHPLLGHCIEMEWVDGITLDQRFAGALPDEELFRKIAAELCDAVAYLHSRQVVHRDIKPSNILITHNGDNVKLIDFGLSDSDDSALLKMAAGTKDHIAPEVLEGRPADVRTDIWAVGKVLEGLTGGHGRAIRKATAARPENRYPHIGAFKDALLERSSKAWLYIVIALVTGALSVGMAIWERYGGAPERTREGTENVAGAAGEAFGVAAEAGAVRASGAARTGESATVGGVAEASSGARAMESGAAGDSNAAGVPAGAAKASGGAAGDSNAAAVPAGAAKAPGAAAVTKPAAKPATKPTESRQASQEDINDLFRQATDLFE